MPLHVDIDPHGRLAPGGDVARRLLADRAGRFLLVPSAPDLLVARRAPPAGGAAPERRCILAGELGAFALPDLVAFVHQSKLSGVLTVSTADGDRTVSFLDGEVRGARSEAPGERLAEVAVRLGHLPPEHLAAALALGDGRALGKLLVERGLVPAPTAWRCVHEQVAVVFHAMLLTREGVFTLVAGEPPEPGAPLSVSTQSLLMDGIRRVDEMALFRGRIPGPDAVLRRTPAALPTALEPLEEELLRLVDGRRTVADLGRAAHLSLFDATKAFYHLAEAGHVEASAERADGRACGADERAGIVAEGMSALLREVWAAVEAAGRRELLAAAVRTFLADPADRFAALWAGVTPAADGAVDVALLRANAARAAAGRADAPRLLFDALHELVLFYLFQAGALLPPPEDDRVNRAVKARFEALAVLR